MTPFSVNLENKIVAVTGAGGIICSAFAKALAENGAKVALLDINYDAAKQYAELCPPTKETALHSDSDQWNKNTQTAVSITENKNG